MDLVSLLLEVFGLVFPAALTFAVQKVVPIAPLRPPLVPLSLQLSAEQQTLLLCALPSCAYIVGRLYFALVFGACSKVFNAVRVEESEGAQRSTTDRVKASTKSLVEFALTAVVFVLPFLHPLVRAYFVSYYESNFAQTVSVLYELSKPEADKAVAFGQKFFLLLCGWFALLFAVELVLRVLLLLVAYALRGVFSLFGGSRKQAEGDKGTKETTGGETASGEVDAKRKTE